MYVEILPCYRSAHGSGMDIVRAWEPYLIAAAWNEPLGITKDTRTYYAADQMVHIRRLLFLSLDFSLVVDQRLLANKLYKVETSAALRLLGRIIQKYSIISKS